MKNLKYFPFERNRYFYGKLLSVDDFETEQRYMNDKRRLLNRFLHGCGVVCGLQVVEVDDLTISLEAGIALDFSGREIVVASPVTKRLSAIEGFYGENEKEERQQIYLCIAYEEKSAEPVHNIARSGGEQEEYNKYEECYRLFVTGEEPEQEGSGISAPFEESKTIFQGEGVRIVQTVPKYIQSGREAMITVTVEKRDQPAKVAFSYRLSLDCLKHGEASHVAIEFDEAKFAPSDTYVFQKKIRAGGVKKAEGSVEVEQESFILFLGQESKKENVEGRFRVSVVEEGVQETVIKAYYQSAMEDIMRDKYGGAIYLARLEVIRAGDTYVIEKITNLPYGQYVWNGGLSGTLETLRTRSRTQEGSKQAPVVYEKERKKEPVRETPAMGKTEAPLRIAMGCEEIYLGIGGVSGKRFYSGEIVHGLGVGEVFISLGAAVGEADEDTVIFGSQTIFRENREPAVSMAAKADMKKGSFVIGVQCMENIETRSLRVSWMAVKPLYSQKREKGMTIRPNVVDIKAGGSCRFEAMIENRAQKDIQWSVKEPEGGSIDAGGCYTAPFCPGVYEIIAKSMESEQRAVAYVVVRDGFHLSQQEERQ